MKTSAFAVLSKRQSKTSGQEPIRSSFQNPHCLQKRDSTAIHFSPRLSTKEKLHRNEVSLHLSTSYQSWQLLQSKAHFSLRTCSGDCACLPAAVSLAELALNSLSCLEGTCLALHSYPCSGPALGKDEGRVLSTGRGRHQH